MKNSDIKVFIIMLLLMFSHCLMAQQTGNNAAPSDGAYITKVCVNDGIETITAQKFSYFYGGEYQHTEIRTLSDVLLPNATVVHDSLCELPEQTKVWKIDAGEISGTTQTFTDCREASFIWANGANGFIEISYPNNRPVTL
ncbi:MAG: hypothetical protein ACPG5B_02300 [Chitinophagales bacterium]